MKSYIGYLKQKLGDSHVLLAGGSSKSLSDFLGSISWDATNKKILYKASNASNWSDLLLFGSNAFNSDNYVTVDTTQTISGTKTFTSTLTTNDITLNGKLRNNNYAPLEIFSIKGSGSNGLYLRVNDYGAAVTDKDWTTTFHFGNYDTYCEIYHNTYLPLKINTGDITSRNAITAPAYYFTSDKTYNIGTPTVRAKLTYTNYVNGGTSGSLWLGCGTESGCEIVGFSGADANGTRLFTIRSGGNVGVGNITPSYKLHVDGTTFTTNLRNNTLASSSTFCMRGSNSGQYLYLDSSDGVCIADSSWVNSLCIANYRTSAKIWHNLSSPITLQGDIRFDGTFRNNTQTSEVFNIRAAGSGLFVRICSNSSGEEGGLGIVDSGWTNTFYISNKNSYTNLYHNTGKPVCVSNSYFGIGTISPSTNLHVVGNIYYTNLIRNCSDISGGDDTITLRGRNNGEYIRICSGDYGLGITDQNWTTTFHIMNKASSCEIYHNNYYPLNINCGNVTSRSNIYAPNFYTSSDARKKKNIHNISDNIKQFEWKESGETSYGFVAQDLEKKHPELVSDNGDTKTVNYNAAICLLLSKLENRLERIERELNIERREEDEII